MPKFKVTYRATAFHTVEVEAEHEEQAREITRAIPGSEFPSIPNSVGWYYHEIKEIN